MKRPMLGALAALILCLGLPARAETPPKLYDDITPAEMQHLLQDAGYRADLKSNDAGPYIASGAAGADFFISFFDCDKSAPPRCSTLEYRSIRFAATPAATAERMVAFNRENGWVAATLDDKGRPFIRMSLSTTGGVTADYLKTMLAEWSYRLGAFVKFLGP